MCNYFTLFFLLDQKESKNQEWSYRPLQVRALLRRLSDHAPHLILVHCTETFMELLVKNLIVTYDLFVLVLDFFVSFFVKKKKKQKKFNNNLF
jgi:hypothetical protein